MKRILLLTIALLLLASTAMAEAGDEFVRNTRNIPEELVRIPDEYKRPAEHAGTLEKLTYETWDSLTYDQHITRLTKTA